MLLILIPPPPRHNNLSRKFWWIYLSTFLISIAGIAIVRSQNIKILKRQDSQIIMLEESVKQLTNRYKSNTTKLQELGRYINDSITTYQLCQYTVEVDHYLDSCWGSISYMFKTVELFFSSPRKLLAGNVRVVFYPKEGSREDSIVIWYHLKDYTLKAINNYNIHFTSENLKYPDQVLTANITIHNREAEKIVFTWNHNPVKKCAVKKTDTMIVVWPYLHF